MQIQFTLKGKQLFAYFITFYIITFLSFFFCLLNLTSIDNIFRDSFSDLSIQNSSDFLTNILLKIFNLPIIDLNPLASVLIYIFLLIFVLIVFFYLKKLFINNICIDGLALQFTGRMKDFLIINIVGIILSIVTIGIYLPFYLVRMLRFFINTTEYKETKFLFRGKGGRLFAIWLLYILVAVLINLLIIFFAIQKFIGKVSIYQSVICIVVNAFILFIFIYYFFKWLISINYKDIQIHFDVNLLNFFLFFCRSILSFSFYSWIIHTLFSCKSLQIHP